MEHLVKIGTSARVLEELRVTSKPAKVKGKAGRRKQKAAVEDLDDDVAEAEEQPGVAPGHHSLMRTRAHMLLSRLEHVAGCTSAGDL